MDIKALHCNKILSPTWNASIQYTVILIVNVIINYILLFIESVLVKLDLFSTFLLKCKMGSLTQEILWFFISRVQIYGV